MLKRKQDNETDSLEDKENYEPNKRAKIVAETQAHGAQKEGSVEEVDADVASLRKKIYDLTNELRLAKGTQPSKILPKTLHPTNEVIAQLTRNIARSPEVRAMLLVPFREQPFAKKIDLEALAKEILADPDLAPIQKYDPKDFTKKMASEISSFFSNQRTQIFRSTLAAMQTYKGWTAEERGSTINGEEIDLCHLKTLAYLGYLDQKEPASENMLDYIKAEILPECCGKILAAETPQEEVPENEEDMN